MFGKDPMEGASPYLQQIPGMAQQYYNPSIMHAGQQPQNMGDYYQQMASNPGQFLSHAQQSYRPTPGYNQKYEEMIKAATNAANQGGNLGTQADQANRMQLANGLMGNDMQQWIQNLMQAQGMGINAQQNYGNQMMDTMGNYIGAQSGLGYNSIANSNNNWNQLAGAGMQTAGTALGGYLGGPGGAAFSNWLFGQPGAETL